jgi:kynureninase
MCDWRDPDVIRIAPGPLYNTFTEVLDFTRMFSSILQKPI